MTKRTKVIATLWPSIDNEEKIIKAYNAWVNVIRFNFSHSNYSDAQKSIDLINNLNNSWKTNLSLLLDTKWPEIRTWNLENSIKYKTWDEFKMYVSDNKLWEKDLFCDYEYLCEDIEIWKKVIIDSWLLEVEVLEKWSDYVLVKALNDSEIWSRRHINLPWVKLKMPWVTKKDKEDILFAIKNNFSFIAASFIRNAWNILEIRKIFEEYSCENCKIISKIENEEAIDNIDEIILKSDWIMIARWDLWIEVPIEKLAVYQRDIIDKCKKYGKFVIIATHLLETMISNPFPTRAESSDVFNSILQSPDSLMLSGETAIWRFPIGAIKMMSKIITEAEKFAEYEHKDSLDYWLNSRDIEKKLLIKSWIYIWEKLDVKCLIIFTKTWLLAKLTAWFRPRIPVYAFTNIESSVGIMNLYFWINGIFLDWWKSNTPTSSSTLEKALLKLKEKGVLDNEDKAIVINDIQKNDVHIPVMEIVNVKDFL